MQTSIETPNPPSQKFVGMKRWFREFLLIFRDPVLFMSLLVSGIFILVFVILPIFRTVSGGFFNERGPLGFIVFCKIF